MSSKFFNNIDTPLIDKFKGIAENMHDFYTFLAVAGYFRSSGYFKLRKHLEDVKVIKILVGINIDDICLCARKILKDNGKLCIVHRTDRFTDVYDAMKKYKRFRARKHNNKSDFSWKWGDEE